MIRAALLLAVLLAVPLSGCGNCPGDSLPSGELGTETLRCLYTPEALGGHNILGTYQYCIDFATDGSCTKAGTPVIRLEAGGGGVFQRHGTSPQKMQWAVLGEGGGPVEIERVDPNFRYVFAWKNLEDAVFDCSPTGSQDPGLVCNPANDGQPTNDPNLNAWQESNFTFKVSSGNILLLGERVKNL